MMREQKGSLQSKVYEYMLGKGPLTVTKIIAGIGRHVSTASCARAYQNLRRVSLKRKLTAIERKKTSSPHEVGRRKCVWAAVYKLMESGRVKRVAPAMYEATKEKS